MYINRGNLEQEGVRRQTRMAIKYQERTWLSIEIGGGWWTVSCLLAPGLGFSVGGLTERQDKAARWAKRSQGWGWPRGKRG